MDIIQAVVIAIVQGVTEFLPISSSAHLILVPELLGWPANDLAFDVAVHIGTLFAVVAFLRKELLQIAEGWLAGFIGFSWDHNGLMGWMLVVAVIPVGLVGFIAGDLVEAHLRTAFIIGLATLFFGLLLGWADHGAENNASEMRDMSFKHAVIVGFAQTLALIPGTSRSGVTMTALLAMGYTRVAAAKFSFLLAVPTIVLPGLLKTNELMTSSETVAWAPLLIGVAVSAIVAFISMRWFIRFVTRVGMRPFVIYRVFLAGVILFVLV